MQISYKKIARLLFHSESAFQPTLISLKHIPYMVGWVLIFIMLYLTLLPIDVVPFQHISPFYTDQLPVFFCLWLFACFLFALFFDPAVLIPKTFYSVFGTILLSIIIWNTKDVIFSYFLFLICAIFIGHIFTSFTYSFFMILNNSEKFYSMLLAVFLPKLILYCKVLFPPWNIYISVPYLFGFLFLISLLICSYFLKYSMFTVPERTLVKAPKFVYSIMPLIFLTLTLNDIIAPIALLQIKNISPEKTGSIYFYGILIGILCIFFIQRKFAIHICHMLNFSFALLAIGFVSHILSIHNPELLFLSVLCFGTAYSISLVNIYYLTGFMMKKFPNIFFYKSVILFTTLGYFICFLFLALVKENPWFSSSSFLSFYSICGIMLYFMFFPFFVKTLFSGEWNDDIYRLDVTHCSRLENKLKEYKLTPSEIEVTKLLLEGFTLRQIASQLGKAYATINTYYVSIYRKLSIQSRSELLLLLKDYLILK